VSQPRCRTGGQTPARTTSYLHLGPPSRRQASDLLEEPGRTSRRARELAAALDREIALEQRLDAARRPYLIRGERIA
jgi:hypothetical protein